MVFDSTYRKQALTSLENDRKQTLKKMIRYVSRKQNHTENFMIYGITTIVLSLLEKTLDL